MDISLMKMYEIEIRGPNLRDVPAKLHCAEMRPWLIQLEHPDLSTMNIEGTDLFSCLASIREQLEELSVKLLCNGARIDAYCSALSRQSSGGKKCYLVDVGRPATRKDLVDIFAPTNEARIGGVSQQREYVQRWLDSMKALR